MSGSTFTVRLLGAAATVLLASACGGTSVTPTAETSPTVTPAVGTGSAKTTTTPGGVLTVASTALGPVLVDSRGLTVYLLTADTPGHSTCPAQCLKFWPPVSGPGGAVPKVSGVSAALAVTKTTGGASILTAGGWPLYTFAKDQASGDVLGQGKKSFGGTWYAVSPSGRAIKAAAKIAPPTTNGANGY